MHSDFDFTQLRAFTAFERGLSVALLGGAGSGKSFVLNRMLDAARKRLGHDGVIACAWTNQASASMRGSTIHTLFGVPAGFCFEKEELWKNVKQNEVLCASLRNVGAIFVDEISVLKDKVLDAIDLVMRYTAGTTRRACLPMGGRQIVLAGDPFQLEPIGVDYEKDGEKHVFSARAWILPFGGFGSGVIVLLKGNHRQEKDAKFYKMLMRMRHGISTEDDLLLINSTGSSFPSPPRSHTVLCLLRSEVEAVNNAELALIPGVEYYSHAWDVYNEKCTFAHRKQLFQMAAKTVTVKPGCEVLLTRKIGKYPPGTRVTVVSVRNHSNGRGKSDLLVLQVSVKGRKEALRVMPARFEVIGCDSTVLACRMQLPIVSAYALTVHRSQGLTLHKVAINFSNIGSWIPTGMAYVALSRCSSMDGLWVRGLQKRHIVVNKHAENVMHDIQKLKKYYHSRVIADRKTLHCVIDEREINEHGTKKRKLDKNIEYDTISVSKRGKIE